MHEHEQDQRLPLPLDNPLWRFSLAVYSAPGVKDECLAAQDTLGADVNVLLYCAWLGAARGIALDAEAVAGIVGAVERWSHAAVVALRAVRRAIKALPEMQHAEVRALRQAVATVELESEQIEQALLFTLRIAQPAGVPSSSRLDLVRNNVASYLGHLRSIGPPASAALQHLENASVAYSQRLDLEPDAT